jgi:hypothetical protein
MAVDHWSVGTERELNHESTKLASRAVLRPVDLHRPEDGPARRSPAFRIFEIQMDWGPQGKKGLSDASALDSDLCGLFRVRDAGIFGHR